MNKKFKYLFVLLLSFCLIGNVKAVYNDSLVGNYETELAKFPCDFKTKIEALHKIYPNAIFVAQDKFFDWNKYKEVEVNWNKMFKAQVGSRSLISASAKASYKTSTCGQKGSNGVCSWYYASNEAITYYMDPVNFLNEKNIFMFESLYSKSYHTKEGVEKILANSFMSNTKCPGSEKTYAEVILEAGEKNNVSPYMLASRLIQEQGRKGTSSLISGTYEGAKGELKGYYNYFNIQASGSTDEEIIENGLKCAKGTLTNDDGKLVCSGNNWTSPYLSIIGGSKFVYKKYIGVNDTYNVKGQMTLYLQKWDPYGPQYGGHQYMQNITAPVSESVSTFNSYASFKDYKNYAYVFYIPVYQDRPTENKCDVENKVEEEKPKEEEKEQNTEIVIKSFKLDNTCLSGVSVGTTQDTFINTLKKDNPNATVNVTKNSNNKSSNIATGDKVTIKNGSNTKTYEIVIYGDVDGDGNIYPTDYVKVKNHIKGSSTLSGIYKRAADVDKDGNVYPTDYVKIKNHIKGTNKLEQ